MRILASSLALIVCSTPAMATAADAAGQSIRAGLGAMLAQADTPLPTPDAQVPDTQEPAAESSSEETPPGADGENLTQSQPDEPGATEGGEDSGDDLSLGEIPIIETMELTPDIAKRALDSYLLVREKYQDSDLGQYENLQDFVDQNPEGKAFAADLAASGFDNVNDWNLAITTLTFAYSSAIDDPTADISLQIAEIEADPELAQDMKDRMILSLKAMIPSENNRKVVADLMADPDYAEKLKLLDIVEE